MSSLERAEKENHNKDPHLLLKEEVFIDWEKRAQYSIWSYLHPEPNIIVEKQSRVPSVLKLKQMDALNQSRALQEIICFYAKNLSLRGLMHFLVAAIMPRLITPEPGEREWHPH